MNTLSSLRTLALGALMLTTAALMGCNASLTGPETSGDQVIHPEQPSMSTSGDAKENDPI